jgi:nucleotide-binding universal stress UspA family protein
MGESIVVGTDGSDSAKLAVQEAIRMAKGLGAELHVVFAYEQVRGKRIAGAPEGAVKVYETLTDTQADAVLSEAAAKARADGVEVSTHAVQRGPADALLEIAGDIRAGTIVVGSKGMHGARRFAIGSVPNDISHKASCNVLIVNTGTGGAAAG